MSTVDPAPPAGREPAAEELHRVLCLQLEARFDRQGAMTVLRDDALLTLRLERLVIGERLRVVPRPTSSEVAGHRLSYIRPNLEEAYIHGDGAIEQRLMIDRRRKEAGSLTLMFHLEGDVMPDLREDHVDFYDMHGARRLRYGDLHAIDAHGRALAVRIGLTVKGLLLMVRDAAARYPLVIDARLEATPD